MFKMFRRSFSIPYPDNLTYPTLPIAKSAITAYCTERNFPFSFEGEGENTTVTICGKPHEILRGMGLGQSGRGGYGISCREL